MMKSKLLSLAALLMAGAASGALAQDQPQIQNGGPMYNAAQQAKARQAQAQAKAQAQQQGPPRAQTRPAPGNPAQAQPPQRGPHGPPQAPQPAQAQPAPWPAQPPQPQPHGWNGPQGATGPNRPDAGRPPHGWPGGGNPPAADRQTWGERGPDRPAPNGPGPGRYGGDGRDGDRRDWNRPGDGRGPDWDRDHGRGAPHDGPQWAPRRYPPIYNSPSRYRGAYWRPPEGYYARAWRYGEILPRAWYGPDYLLFDWWNYALPEPPPGYDWVRVGRDALLVDYNGRIVQVVRMVFW